MAKSKSEPVASSEPPSFEESLAALEAIVAGLEDGDLTLTESLARYEEGVGHLKRCHEFLEQTERKIELLTGLDENGNPRTQPFDEGSTTLDEKAASRSRRRTSSEE